MAAVPTFRDLSSVDPNRKAPLGRSDLSGSQSHCSKLVASPDLIMEMEPAVSSHNVEFMIWLAAECLPPGTVASWASGKTYVNNGLLGG